MISKLTGILDHADMNSITLDVNGVGYHVFMPSSAIGKLPKSGGKVVIYTRQVVKEDSHELYGFLTKDEKNLFSIILSVSGFGPKSAINLLSSFKLEQLITAITKGKVDLLTSVPGVGLKTAQRLVIELKEKVGKVFAIQRSEIAQGLPTDDPMMSDAISALVTLGYSPKEAREAILNSGLDLTKVKSVEDVIKQSLKVFS
ncbi:Holliday junction branch migration protein RuvA [Candidatus Margulisiibacteriota bacterium]